MVEVFEYFGYFEHASLKMWIDFIEKVKKVEIKIWQFFKYLLSQTSRKPINSHWVTENQTKDYVKVKRVKTQIKHQNKNLFLPTHIPTVYN